MHMKHLGLLLLLILSIPAHALIVSVDDYGQIPAEGMEITLTEPEQDILTGEDMFTITGSLIAPEQLTVTITRPSTDIVDEFCCAGECVYGNGETSEEIHFNTNGLTNWFVHYTPSSESAVTILYTFSDGVDERRLTVHYNYQTEAIEITNHKSQIKNRKVLRDGIIYIISNDKEYPIL